MEAARRGRAEIALKGKVRVILLPEKLCRKLLKYAKKQKIVSGEVFLTRNGRSLSRRQIDVYKRQAHGLAFVRYTGNGVQGNMQYMISPLKGIFTFISH